MKRRRAEGVGASHNPARSSSLSDKEDAQDQGFPGAEVAAAEAKEEDGEKVRVAEEGGVCLVAVLGRGVHGRRGLRRALWRCCVGRRPLELEGFGETKGLRERER
ncbi:uncharacterized protein J3R85_007118, partial [Psidium guajava]